VSSSDWWAARLRGSQAPPPPVTQYYAPQQTAFPQYVQPQSAPVSQALDITTYKAQLAQALRDKRISPEVAAAEWAKLGAGDGTKFEPYGCPQCSGPRYFERRVLRTMNDQLRTMSMAPAPMCMDCGYAGALMDVQHFADTHPVSI
jgi:hypothetical protein